MNNRFAKHAMRRERGCTWRCAKPGTNNCSFRVTWAPGMIAISGDLGSLIVEHYSFGDPWSAAAWINGAGWDYFMEKTGVEKEFDPEGTAKHIIERAYELLRRDGDDSVMKGIVDTFGSSYDDPDAREDRKSACRQMLDSDELTAPIACEITDDFEAAFYEYPKRYRHQHDALRWWANRMWETEPAWHVALRHWRHARRELRDLRRTRVLFGPIRYVRFNGRGLPEQLNGSMFWVWDRSRDTPVYRAVRPFRVFGKDLSRFGLWCLQGSTWSDDGPVDRWGRPTVESAFRDVRPAGVAA